MLNSTQTDILFTPSVTEMYPNGISLNVSEQLGTFVSVLGKSHQLEGSVRKHFFRGVATVVLKLLNIIQPSTAYFGQKDVQQCCVVKTMAKDLHLDLEIAVSETTRETDGLAMSSRNRFLRPDERLKAPILYTALSASKKAFDKGERDSKILIRIATEIIDTEKDVVIQYLSLNNIDLSSSTDGKGGILSGAVMIGKTRIIDNVLLGVKF